MVTGNNGFTVLIEGEMEVYLTLTEEIWVLLAGCLLWLQPLQRGTARRSLITDRDRAPERKKHT